MNSRRNFLKNSLLLTALASFPASILRSSNVKKTTKQLFNNPLKPRRPIVVSTWNHGLAANEKAWEIVVKGGKALDAVEQGVRISESDPKVMSVGYGGLPDREGHVTLDACIMNEKGNCGSVAFLEHIKNPISVARLVMENTPHVMLVGKGALDFSLMNGFKKENLLTNKAAEIWHKWKESNQVPLTPEKDNHDTIGMLALDKFGNICGACTTSGLAWKLHGRVGDSPIIGAGMFVDNEVGGAVATGKGEAVMKISGTHLVVELMRQGKSPEEACKLAVERIIKKQHDHKEFQVGFLALNKKGESGAYSISKGFEYAQYAENKNELIKSNYSLK